MCAANNDRSATSTSVLEEAAHGFLHCYDNFESSDHAAYSHVHGDVP